MANMKYKICVSGAAETGHCAPNALEMAKEVGREIVRQGGILVTGATSGVAHWAAKGAKEEGGMSIGISPASSELEHVKKYRLPIDFYDVIIYTGFAYAGRDLLLTRASDAVVTICGRTGTLHEFTVAFEDKKPQGVLLKSGGAADMVKDIVEKLHKSSTKVVYDESPKELIQGVVKLIQKERAQREEIE